MQASENQLIAERHPELSAYQSEAPVSGGTSGSATLLDPLELESLKLIMDASLRVHARHHFFTWTQGLLQDLGPSEKVMSRVHPKRGIHDELERFELKRIQ